MSLQTAADVPLFISSPNSSSERRITPSWSIAQLKTRLEPITGIPATSQQLTLRLPSHETVAIAAADEEQTQLAAFALQPYAEITVSRLSSSLFLSLPLRHSPIDGEQYGNPVPGRRRAVAVSPAATLCCLRWTEATPA